MWRFIFVCIFLLSEMFAGFSFIGESGPAPNFGNDSGYFYANNLATTSPSYPKYGWKDTAGSWNLLLNGLQAAGSSISGNLDDGYFRLSLRNILLSTGQDTTNKHIRYGGNCYDSIFPATNGMIGFTQAYGNTSLSEYKVDGALVPKNALLPMWHDFNLGSIVSSLSNRLCYKVNANQLIITYDKVQSFEPATDWVSFQIVIEIVTGCSGVNANFRYTFADTTSGQTSFGFVNDYLAAYISQPGDPTTFRNYFAGFSKTGAPIPYSSYVAIANPFPAVPPTQSFVRRPIYDFQSRRGLAVEFGPNINFLNAHDMLLLKVSVSLQGLQSNFRVRDTVEVILRDAFAPFNILKRKKVYLDSAFNERYSYGTKTFELSQLKRSYPYYIVIDHRNSVLSWSNITTTSGDTLNYDFTSAVSQTYGNNSKLVNNAASIYSGDTDSTHNGSVNLTDMISILNASVLFTTGNYLITDLNFDGTVSLPDLVIAANNNTAFICKKEP